MLDDKLSGRSNDDDIDKLFSEEFKEFNVFSEEFAPNVDNPDEDEFKTFIDGKEVDEEGLSDADYAEILKDKMDDKFRNGKLGGMIFDFKSRFNDFKYADKGKYTIKEKTQEEKQKMFLLFGGAAFLVMIISLILI